MKINSIAQYDCSSRNYDKNNKHSNVKFGEVKRFVINAQHYLGYPGRTMEFINEILESPYIKELSQKHDFDIILKNVTRYVVNSNYHTTLTMTIKAPKRGISLILAEIGGRLNNFWNRGDYYYSETLSKTPAKNPLPDPPKILSEDGCNGDCTQAWLYLLRRIRLPDPFNPPAEPEVKYYYSLSELFADRNK